MKELDDIARAAGVDTGSAEYRLATALAEADGDLLEQLVEVRKAKGLTQQAVAERMRRDKSAVSISSAWAQTRTCRLSDATPPPSA